MNLKLIFVGFLLPVFASCESSQKATSSSQEAAVEVPVGIVESGNYYLKRLESYSDGQLVDSFDYALDANLNTLTRRQNDVEGNPVDIIYYFDSSGGLSRIDYISDFEGTRTEHIRRGPEGRVERILVESPIGAESISFKYSSGLLVESVAENDLVSVTSTYSYDADGLLLEFVTVNESAGETEKTSFTYNMNGQRTSTQLDFMSDGSVEESASIEYDENDNVSVIEYYLDDGELFERSVFTYEEAAVRVPNIISFFSYLLPQ